MAELTPTPRCLPGTGEADDARWIARQRVGLRTPILGSAAGSCNVLAAWLAGCHQHNKVLLAVPEGSMLDNVIQTNMKQRDL